MVRAIKAGPASYLGGSSLTKSRASPSQWRSLASVLSPDGATKTNPFNGRPVKSIGAHVGLLEPGG
jgi:hypothetical protein